MEDQVFDDTLRLAGWLLAHQIHAAQNGDSPLPLLCFQLADLGAPQMVGPRTNAGSYSDHVRAGRVLIKDQGASWIRWAYAYDEDFGPSGRIMFLEMGGQEFGSVITIAQGYSVDEERGFRLLGDLELIGREFLPSAAYDRLEGRSWRDLLNEGAIQHEEAGQSWPAWHAARDRSPVRLQMGEFTFAAPEGWIYRLTREGHGWLMARLLPWEHSGYEPTIMVLAVGFPNLSTLEEVLEDRKADLIANGDEVLEAEIFPLPSPSWPRMAGRLTRTGEEDGRNTRTTTVWVPTDAPGHFLGFWASSFSQESWENLVQALDAVLQSLVKEESAMISPRVPDEDSPSWLSKLWKKRR